MNERPQTFDLLYQAYIVNIYNNVVEEVKLYPTAEDIRILQERATAKGNAYHVETLTIKDMDLGYDARHTHNLDLDRILKEQLVKSSEDKQLVIIKLGTDGVSKNARRVGWSEIL